MTGKRMLERRVDRLDSDRPGEVFVVRIGGDPDDDRPTGWVSREEYVEHNDREDPSEFEWHYEGSI